MHLSANDLTELCDLAEQAAVAAGELIQSYDGATVDVQRKSTSGNLASQVVTEVDQKSEALIIQMLSESISKFDLAVLCEESDDDKQRLKKDFFWCIDPLDGTLAFTESKPGYSVSIALVSREGEPFVGVVYDPVTETLYSAVQGQGVKKNGAQLDRLCAADKSSLLLPCDRSLVSQPYFNSLIDVIERNTRQLGIDSIDIIYDGGAVMNACHVLESAHGCYFKQPKTTVGGGSIWDFAATACLFNEAGLMVTRFEGERLDLNNANSTFMHHSGVIYATNREIKASIQRAVAAISSAK